MINQQLLDYIQKALEAGHSVEQITPALLGQGWNNEDIKKAAAQASEAIAQKSGFVMPPPAPAKKGGLNVDIKNFSAAQILLYLGGLIVVLAGIIYIGINWSQWGSVARIFAIFLPMFVCYLVGGLIWSSGSRKDQGIAFIVVGSLLFPFFLAITFKELNIFSHPYNDQFNLTVSLLSLVLFVIFNFTFRHPVWVFLYHTVAVLTYYFFLKVIGIESFFSKQTMAWLLLIPGTAYLLLGREYDKKQQELAGEYSYTIGAVIIVISFVRLFFETFIKDVNLAWLLLVCGIAYFVLGMFQEKGGYKKYSLAPYVIGVGIVFFSLFRLGTDGSLLKPLAGSHFGYTQDIIGISNVIVGIIYLLFGYILGKCKDFQLEEASKLKEFFNLVAPFWVLGALFSLGLGGHKPVYETLLLVSSLGFIFGSIPTLVRQYLFVGTFFLIVYIFSIGGEYFQNQVGWPITLFMAGLISMGIGVAIEKVGKKYFVV